MDFIYISRKPQALIPTKESTMKCLRFILALATLLILSSIVLQAQVTWTKYSGNPIVPATYTNPDAPFSYQHINSPAVMWDSASNQYLMLFGDVGSGGWEISSAVSKDGINWFFDQSGPKLTTGSWDNVFIQPNTILFEVNQYWLYYEGFDGYNTAIGLATSTDGKTWQKYSGNPIMSGVPGTWENNGNGGPLVTYNGSKFIMIYGGGSGSFGNVIGAVGEAESVDGYNWTKSSSNPVMSPGDSTSWDNTSLVPLAMCVANGTYVMICNKQGSANAGFATSSDAIHWTMYASNPVFNVGTTTTWDSSALGYGAALFMNNQFNFWYTGMGSAGHWQVGLATSPMSSMISKTAVKIR
jgi:predicted GH43/DUF377 family glycosyl hydrolase